MNVEIRTEAAHFLFGEYINRIFFAVQESEVFWTRDTALGTLKVSGWLWLHL